MPQLYTLDNFLLWAEISLPDLIVNCRNNGAFNLLDFLVKIVGIDLTTASAALDDPTVLAGRTVTLDVVRCTTSFNLNTIPQCTLGLVVGWKMTDISRVALIHWLQSALMNMVHVWVYCQAVSEDGLNNWPKDEIGEPTPFCIFEGRAMAHAERVGFGAADFVLHLVHWLIDLAYSSALTRMTTPNDPGSLAFNASIPNVINSSIPATDCPLCSCLGTIGSFQTLSTDFWGFYLPNPDYDPDLSSYQPEYLSGGLKLFLISLSEVDRFNWPQFQYWGFQNKCPIRDQTPRQNTEALAALNRMEPFFNDDGSVTYEYGVPLALKYDATVYGPRIGGAVTQVPLGFNALASSTIWDTIIQRFSGDFGFAVVPMVDRALVVPYTPGLNWLWQNIQASEYTEIDLQVVMPRPIRAVSIQAAFQTATGAGAINPGTHYPFGIFCGAVYDTCRDGMVVLARPPDWMGGVIMSNFSAAENITGKASTQSSPSPAGRDPGAAKNFPLLNQDIPVLRAYAQFLYLKEVLRHRQLRLTGKVRFDIAPGSAIGIETAIEKYVQPTIMPGQVPPYLYGTVVSVTTTLDAENQHGSTSFQVAYVRDEAENKDPATSTDQHPFWKNYWTGAPLVADPAFHP